MHVGENISKWGIWSILKIEYEDLMELVVDDDLNYDESEVIKMRFESHCEIGDNIKQMCINLYNGGSIDHFEYGEDFCTPCSGYSDSEYEDDKMTDYQGNEEDHTPDPVGDQPDPMWIDGAIDGDSED